MSHKLSLFLTMFFVITLLACGKDDSENKGNDVLQDFQVSLSEMKFEARGGEVTFYVEGGTPEVNCDAAWIKLVQLYALQEKSAYRIECRENDTEEERTAKISLSLYGQVKSIAVAQSAPAPTPVEDPDFPTASDIASKMYPGWNLGNTLEATSSDYLFTNKGGLATETSWQPTKTKQKVIDAVRDAGFKSVRIPVAWIAGHIVSGTQTTPKIDAAWIKRVKEVVDYCINDGLYVIVNDHWDGGWIEELGFSRSTSYYSAIDDKYATEKAATLKFLWTQIAEAFKDYDEHLLFAGLNEPFQNYSLFNDKHKVLTPYLEKYNKAFVEAVRATGGNNSQRILVVQGPSTNIDSSVSYMKASSLPESAGRLMVEVHYYDPGQFCGTWDASGDKAFYFWGATNHSSSHNATYAEESYLRQQFEKLRSEYTSKGYPVIIGEYAANQRTITTDQSRHNSSIYLFYRLVNEYAVSNGIIPFAWDTNYPAGLNKESGSSTIIDRANATVVGIYAMEGIRKGCSSNK